MNNRWSDAARAASIAVRSFRGAVQRPVAGADVAPMKGGGLARNNVVVTPFKTVSAAGAAPAGGNNPGPHIWIPPPDDPVWGNPKFVESFKQGVAERKAKEVATATFPTKPNIFYSSTGPQKPVTESPSGGSPKMGSPKGGAPKWNENGVELLVAKRPASKVTAKSYGGVQKKSAVLAQNPSKNIQIPRPSDPLWRTPSQTRFVIGGRRYTKVGNTLVPDA